MHEEVIARMRGRIRQMRRIIGLAHDREMIAMLSQMIEEIEADIRRLEAETAETTLAQDIPPPAQA
jgi:chemotaxis regulatin CheY-phosphate phosphatase CheZ